jgi:hypothetical protein
VSDLELLRRLAPAVDPPSEQAAERVRARLRAAGHARPRPSRPRALVAAPLVLGAALLIVLVAGQLGGGRTPAFAAEAVRAAQAAPRLLVAGGGWTVARVDEWNAATGEMRFTGEGGALDLSWSPAEVTGTKVGAAKDGARPEAVTTVLGARAAVHRYAGTDDYTASWRDGDAVVQARGRAPSVGAFVDVLQRIERVSAETWLGALPASAVTPADHGETVDEMLAGLPLPPGLDVAALRAGATTRDRYQLGAQVVSAVACGWIARWVDARAKGDADGARAAAEALATSRQWPVVRQMARHGDYPAVLWDLTDAIRDGAPAKPGKPGLSVEQAYRDALGC